MPDPASEPIATFSLAQLTLIKHWLARNDVPWILASRQALAGDLSALKERVALLGPEADRLLAESPESFFDRSFSQ